MKKLSVELERDEARRFCDMILAAGIKFFTSACYNLTYIELYVENEKEEREASELLNYAIYGN